MEIQTILGVIGVIAILCTILRIMVVITQTRVTTTDKIMEGLKEPTFKIKTKFTKPIKSKAGRPKGSFDKVKRKVRVRQQPKVRN